MHVRIQKWGNSLAVRIPRQIAKEVHLEEGSEINLTERSGQILLDPIEKSVTLAELLEGIRPENLHDATDFGPARGNEVW